LCERVLAEREQLLAVQIVLPDLQQSIQLFAVPDWLPGGSQFRQLLLQMPHRLLRLLLLPLHLLLLQLLPRQRRMRRHHLQLHHHPQLPVLPAHQRRSHLLLLLLPLLYHRRHLRPGGVADVQERGGGTSAVPVFEQLPQSGVRGGDEWRDVAVFGPAVDGFDPADLPQRVLWDVQQDLPDQQRVDLLRPAAEHQLQKHRVLAARTDSLLQAGVFAQTNCCGPGLPEPHDLYNSARQRNQHRKLHLHPSPNQQQPAHLYWLHHQNHQLADRQLHPHKYRQFLRIHRRPVRIPGADLRLPVQLQTMLQR